MEAFPRNLDFRVNMASCAWLDLSGSVSHTRHTRTSGHHNESGSALFCLFFIVLSESFLLTLYATNELAAQYYHLFILFPAYVNCILFYL